LIQAVIIITFLAVIATVQKKCKMISLPIGNFYEDDSLARAEKNFNQR